MHGKGKTLEEYVEKVLEGKIKLHELDKVLGNSNLAALVRRLVIEKLTNTSLSAIASTIINFEEIVGVNIENPIGAIQVPLGIAGPLKIEGEYAKGEFYVPLATTESSLVTGVNRGMRVINESGGARTRILHDGIACTSLFWVPDIETAVKLVKWVQRHFNEIKKEVGLATRYGELIRVDPYIIGNNVYLYFTITIGDAVKTNTITIAINRVCECIEKNFPWKARCVVLDYSTCCNSFSATNMLKGHGRTVVAEALIPDNVAREILGVEVEHIYDINIRRNLLESSRTRMLSHSTSYTSIIAAIFLATGQDLACVVESSIGYTWTELRDDKTLYISVILPSLRIGTIGGGTRLPTQREALRIMGVAGSGDPPGANARKFAEIIAATVLAGELYSLAILAKSKLA